MESPLVVAQRAAIQDARARYERGEIAVAQLQNALDEIASAPDTRAVEAALAGLPAAPRSALAAFELAPPAPRPAGTVGAGGTRGVSRVSSFMGKTHRVKPWTLAEECYVSAFMGETVVDLRQARLPAHAVMRVNAVMSEIRIIVPENVRVYARSSVIMGEAHVLGSVGSGEEEYEPPSGEVVAELEIQASVIMGVLKIVLANEMENSISELARAAITEALESARAHLAERKAQRATLNPGPRD